MLGLLLSDDLLDSSRITGTARALGLTVRTVRSLDALLKLAGEGIPTCVLVDLHHPGLNLGNLLDELQEVCTVRPRVVGYGSHVDAARLRAARDAGCDLVLPRSAFVERLPTELAEWLAPMIDETAT